MSISVESAFLIFTWIANFVFVGGAIYTDTRRNPLNHPADFKSFRTINWCLIGFSYALSYMGRYNVVCLSPPLPSFSSLTSICKNVSNTDQFYAQFALDADQFGQIITVGFWVYSVCVIFNGYIVDKIGARNGILIGTLGASFANLLEGLYLQFTPWLGSKFVVGMCVLFGINNYFQTFSTSAICKAGVNWYHIRERGFFSGIFGVVISFGYFLAFSVDGFFYEKLPVQWIYYIPSALLLTMFLLDYFITAAIPENKFPPETLVTLRGADFDSAHFVEANPGFREVIGPILSQKIFFLFAAIELCVGWSRDGILSWYGKFFDSMFDLDKLSIQYNIAATGVTVGGMFGSLSAGVMSDLFFHSRRPPVAFLNMAGYLTVVILLYICLPNSYLDAILIGLSSIFFSGVHGIITSTAAMDFAGSGATGTAVGLLDGVQKIASGLTGNLMGAIIGKWDWRGWVVSLMPMAVLALCLILPIINRVPEGADLDDKDSSKKLASGKYQSLPSSEAFEMSPSSSPRASNLV
jgi:OPA family glycerol-3-phosphate transporter-like MFS transporter